MSARPIRLGSSASVLSFGVLVATTTLLGSARANPLDPADFALVDVTMGSGPRALVLADLDGDGARDLLAVDEFSSRLSMRFGDGAGGFSSLSWKPVGPQPVDLAACDLDGDGLLDVVTANTGNSTVSLLLGAGGGALQSAISVSGGVQPMGLDVGDVDGDGDPDVVTAGDDLVKTVALLPGDGVGGLFAPSFPLGGFCATDILLVDVDLDGDLDAVISDDSHDSVVVLPGLGAGAFGGAVSIAVPSDPRGLAAGDLDGDGQPELFVAASGDSVISVIRHLGGFVFSDAEQHDVGLGPYAVAVGDVDGDEDLDVVAADFGSLDVALLLGDGHGALAAGPLLDAGLGPVDVALGDLDGDFLADVAIVNQFSNDAWVHLAQIGPWIDLGGGVAGAAGEAVLQGSGEPVPHDLVSVLVTGIDRRKKLGHLLIGVERLDAPYKGGVLVPDPLVISKIRPDKPLVFRWPDVPAGASLYMQVWFDLKGRKQATGSNALRAVGQAP
ncbi:MAG: VCBS repeat-containing protein [Planctomycetes bacterium]|nr:VCBS repeat-containing protein [Planctomycetota bacterium]